jgi:hypothetical protein
MILLGVEGQTLSRSRRFGNVLYDGVGGSGVCICSAFLEDVSLLEAASLVLSLASLLRTTSCFGIHKKEIRRSSL